MRFLFFHFSPYFCRDDFNRLRRDGAQPRQYERGCRDIHPEDGPVVDVFSVEFGAQGKQGIALHPIFARDR